MARDMEDVVAASPQAEASAIGPPAPESSADAREPTQRAITDALVTKNYSALASLCLEAELRAASEGLPHPCYLEHMLALLYTLDPAPVRLFAQRLSSDSAHTPQLRAASAALQRRPPTLHTVLTQAYIGPSSTPLPAHAEPLLRAIIARSRADALLRLALAYSNVSVAKAAAALSVSEEAVRAICKEAGWVVEDGFVEIVKSPVSAPSGAGGREGPAAVDVNVGGKRMNAEESLAALAEMTERLVRLQD